MEDQNVNQQRVPLTQVINQHWNSEYMKSVRLSFLDGEQLPQCQHCWRDEAAGKVSGRLRRNQQYYGQGEILINDPIIKNTLNQTRPDGYSDYPFKGLFFSVGNLCQLRCIDCSPSYSRSILKDYEKLGWGANTKNRRFIMQQDLLHDDIQHDQSLWERIEHVGAVEWIRVQGGEPSISKPLLKFLRGYAEKGYAEHTTIFIVTNAGNVKQEFIDALKPFRQVKFEISVDGVGALDEYVRYPTNWTKKESIIDQLLSEFPGGVIHSTMYSLNIGGLPKLIQWAEEKPAMHSIQSLTYPDELAVQHLPPTYKQEMINLLWPWTIESAFTISNNYDPTAYRNNGVRGIVGRLEQSGDPKKWAEARTIIHSYDTIRTVSLGTISPALLPYL